MVLLVASLALPAIALAQPPPSSEAVFRALILDRIRAYGRGDADTYLAMLADGFVHVSDRGDMRTTEQMRAFVGGHGDNRASYDVASIHWQIEGNVAIVDAVVHEHLPDMEGGLRETDIFVGRHGRWRYLRHQETTLLQPPIPAKVEDHLADYVGRYQTATGTIDIISTRAGRLFDRSTPSEMPTPFVQVARGVFGFADDPTLAVFLRDDNGKVTQCVWHLPSGQTVLSRREQ